jgi:hypothetical protein
VTAIDQENVMAIAGELVREHGAHDPHANDRDTCRGGQ